MYFLVSQSAYAQYYLQLSAPPLQENSGCNNSDYNNICLDE